MDQVSVDPVAAYTGGAIVAEELAKMLDPALNEPQAAALVCVLTVEQDADEIREGAIFVSPLSELS